MTEAGCGSAFSTVIWLVISSFILLALLHVVLKRLILNPVSQLWDLI